MVMSLLFVSIGYSSIWTNKVAGFDHHPSAQHDGAPPTGPDPTSVPDDASESAEVVGSQKPYGANGLLFEKEKALFAGDGIRAIYEVGNIPNFKAEEESHGDDWIESYQPGVDSQMYRNIEPGADGNKIYHPPSSQHEA